ncbi:MAG: glycosyltransferase family 2 protein [Methanospirillum sp.]|uniref:glycosyltransferase family 2 protein n=1 Tax=Methanospirillum sp. TaxID=45200 RepID=UPI00236D61F2|nr:glycosyltransferase family 2 protein [Methanospirillum sp.]MDD1728045.1 glycosyltransferase family 2 protein [Methanospirillum sp.]
MKTSLVVPAFNEEKAIGAVIQEYYSFVDEIIVVDDGSSDKTYQIASDLSDGKVSVSRHDKNQGKVGALITGVRKATGDIIIFTDADCTYPARYIPDFIKELTKGADLVLGSRIIESHNIPLFNRFGNAVFSILATYISGKEILDGQTGMRAFRKDMFNSLSVKAKSLEFETKMTVRAAKLGYNIVEIPIEYRERVGISKLHPVRDGYRMLRALLSIAWYETSPLAKMISAPGILVSFVGLFFGLYSLYERITHYHLVHEYYPLISVFLILFGVQLTSIGLIIDYLTKKLDRIEEKMRR